jgi:hypothetical protein
MLINRGINLDFKCDFDNYIDDSGKRQTILSFFLEEYPEDEEIIDLLKSKNAPENVPEN